MKRIIPTVEIVSDLKQGMSDKELMEKYRLSVGGLEKLLGKLPNAIANGSRGIEVESKEQSS